MNPAADVESSQMVCIDCMLPSSRRRPPTIRGTAVVMGVFVPRQHSSEKRVNSSHSSPTKRPHFVGGSEPAFSTSELPIGFVFFSRGFSFESLRVH